MVISGTQRIKLYIIKEIEISEMVPHQRSLDRVTKDLESLERELRGLKTLHMIVDDLRN